MSFFLGEQLSAINHENNTENNVYQYMQQMPNHHVRTKAEEFSAKDVPLIKAGKLIMKRRQERAKIPDSE